MLVNFGTAKKYEGKCNLFFDDTNPSKEKTEFVDAIRRDIAWIGYQWEKEVYASDFFDVIYEYAEKLIIDGKAFVCDLSPEEISATRGTLIEAGKKSPYRNRSVEENLRLFREMKEGKYPDGKEALKAELEELKQSMAQQQSNQPTYADQVALLEKSYELAAKYMPGGTATTTESKAEEVETTTRSGKSKAVPVGQISKPVVSALAQPVSDSMIIARIAQSVGSGFNTAVGAAPMQNTRNTIKACVHGDQTITSGQSVRLRLLEAMRVGKYVLPRNTLITGEGSIKGERLDIEILQVEYNGTIIPVELTVHDNDGQEGIFIPGSMEVSAAKEMAANLGQNLGTSISITNQSAGDQLLSEVGRGAIQGVSQYISKKMREEKVHLKSGYNLMLYQNNQ